MPEYLVFLIKDHLEQAWYEGRDYKVVVTPSCDGAQVEVYYPDEDRNDVFHITVERVYDD